MRRFDTRIQQIESQLYVERDARGSAGKGKEQRPGSIKFSEFPGAAARYGKNQVAGVADLVKGTPGAIADIGRDVGDIVTGTPNFLKSVGTGLKSLPGALSNIGKPNIRGFKPTNPLVHAKNFITGKVDDIATGVKKTMNQAGKTLDGISKGDQFVNSSLIRQSDKKSVVGNAMDTVRSGASVVDDVTDLTSPKGLAKDIAINSLTNAAMDGVANSLANKTNTASPDKKSTKTKI